MENLDSDTLATIFSYLPEYCLEKLLVINPIMVSTVIEDPLYWKQRLESLLGRHFNQMLINWKNVYYFFRDEDWYEDPLKLALDENQSDVVAVLTGNDWYNYSTETINKSLREAGTYGYVDIVKVLLKHPKSNPTGDNYRTIRSIIYSILLSENGNVRLDLVNFRRLECLQVILSSPRVDLYRVLMITVNVIQDIRSLGKKKKKLESQIIMTILNNSRANDFVINNNVFIIMVDMGYYNVVKFLLEFDNINPGLEALSVATNKNYFNIAKLLLNNPKTNLSNVN